MPPHPTARQREKQLIRNKPVALGPLFAAHWPVSESPTQKATRTTPPGLCGVRGRASPGSPKPGSQRGHQGWVFSRPGEDMAGQGSGGTVAGPRKGFGREGVVGSGGPQGHRASMAMKRGPCHHTHTRGAARVGGTGTPRPVRVAQGHRGGALTAKANAASSRHERGAAPRAPRAFRRLRDVSATEVLSRPRSARPRPVACVLRVPRRQLQVVVCEDLGNRARRLRKNASSLRGWACGLAGVTLRRLANSQFAGSGGTPWGWSPLDWRLPPRKQLAGSCRPLSLLAGG